MKNQQKKKKEDIKKLITEILGSKDNEDCYLSVLKSCCVGVREEKFVLANGAGRNGKGLISQLMALMLGKDYYYQGNCCTLTQQIKSGANPEIANMHKKRMVIFSEPEENAYLYLGVIKALTGEDTANARGLYSSNTETTLLGTTILEVNGKPNINGKINDSAIERWINIYFPNLYTDNDAIIDNRKIFKQNKLYKEHEWRLQMRCALFDVLREVENNRIIIPKSIRVSTFNYLMDNDSLLKWFNEVYEIVEENNTENIIKVANLYNHFKQTESYINLSKKQKRDEFNQKGFIEKIKENVKLRQYYREEATYTINGKQKHFRNILTCVIKKQDENDDENNNENDDENDDENNISIKPTCERSVPLQYQ
jgi:phage/plasmid-associated DNA primase